MLYRAASLIPIQLCIQRLYFASASQAAMIAEEMRNAVFRKYQSGGNGNMAQGLLGKKESSSKQKFFLFFPTLDWKESKYVCSHRTGRKKMKEIELREGKLKTKSKERRWLCMFQDRCSFMFSCCGTLEMCVAEKRSSLKTFLPIALPYQVSGHFFLSFCNFQNL